MENIEQLLNGESPLFSTSEFETAASVALKAFTNQYRAAITSADIQTFIIGFRAGYGLCHDKNSRVTNVDHTNQWKN